MTLTGMNTKAKAFLIITAMLFAGFVVLNYESHDKIVFVDIESGRYTDLNGDGFEDDVELVFTIDLHGFDDYRFEEGIEIEIFLSLTLPSGLDFEYEVVEVVHKANLTMVASLYNHATESGNYEVYSFGKYGFFNINKPVLSTQLLFDPPGGQSGDDPRAVFNTF